MMNIHIIGAGAIGKLFAAKLSKSAKPLLVTRTETQARAIGKEGLQLIDANGPSEYGVDCLAAADYQQSILASDVNNPDAILLTVKQHQLDESLFGMLRIALRDGGMLIAMHNGIGHIERLQSALGDRQVAAAVTTEGARSTDPRSVIHTGQGWTKIGFGSPMTIADSRLKDVENCLRAAGFVISLSNEITKDMWNKLVINSVINPLTAIYGLTNGELLQSSYLRRTMRSLYEEALTAAECAGVSMGGDALWEELLEVCRRTAGNRSSMLQDVEAMRPTEIEWINGALVRIALQYGVHLPYQETMLQAVYGIEQSRYGR